MRAVKAFRVFIRLPKPRAPLPIRLVDTASHVNEMQRRETLTSCCQILQNTNPLLHDSIIQVLRKSLLSAANEIKLLKEENGAVKEQRDLMEDEQRQMRKFEEELKVKGELLKGETRKRQARTKVHMDRLPLLTKAEEEIRRNDQQ
ncbi:hypothetical protein EXN66_Car018372 [Channa argus]|uniref:Uncharacterized protein n=1 Tax=Channa argus TaxID=215402 RepID=A0A6G1QJP6_CHAAH|nr:hypothetical protein EXN66_Car018372 [Channa argus]